MKRWIFLVLLLSFDVFSLWWTTRLLIVAKITATAFDAVWAIFIKNPGRHFWGLCSFILGQSRSWIFWLSPLILSFFLTWIYVRREKRRRQISN
jgi:hypothetical protein